MKFIVSRRNISPSESKRPCDEALEEILVPLDYRTVATLEDAKQKIWYKDWFNGGENHREENGMVVCDKKVKVKQWVCDFNTLEELIAFQSKYGDITISDSSPYKGVNKEIKIHDPIN